MFIKYTYFTYVLIIMNLILKYCVDDFVPYLYERMSEYMYLCMLVRLKCMFECLFQVDFPHRSGVFDNIFQRAL